MNDALGTQAPEIRVDNRDIMTHTLPKISIVTPSFNQGEFLEECIESVLSQNYPNLEYIIMDGGSSDNSVEIISKYKNYLKYWQSQPDGGQYAAIEDGFSRSTGEIMAWLNSDDKYHHNAFYKIAYIFSSFQNMEWIVGRQTCWDKCGDVSFVNRSLPTYGRERFMRKDYCDPHIQQESSFWRRSLWEKAGGYLRKDLAFAGDLELWLRFFRCAELHSVDAILGGFRNHGNQKSVLFAEKYRTEAEALLDTEIDLYNRTDGAECSTPPDAVPVPADLVSDFIDTACAGLELKSFRYGDDSDKVASCLIRQFEDEQEAMCRTLSWRITQPLRWLGGMFNK